MAIVSKHRKIQIDHIAPDGTIRTMLDDVSIFCGVPLECDICGEEEPIAFWEGHRTVSICRECAITVLPRLIGDAVIVVGLSRQP